MVICQNCGRIFSEEWLSDRIAEIQEGWEGHDPLYDMPTCPDCGPDFEIEEL